VYSVKKKSYAKTRNGSVKRLIRGDDEVHATPFALLASWVSSSQRQRAQHHRVRVRKPQQLGGESKTAASEAQVGRPANGSAPSYVQWLPAGARCRDRAPTRSATGLERRWLAGRFPGVHASCGTVHHGRMSTDTPIRWRGGRRRSSCMCCRFVLAFFFLKGCFRF
jgi:hypothetical protein